MPHHFVPGSWIHTKKKKKKKHRNHRDQRWVAVVFYRAISRLNISKFVTHYCCCCSRDYVSVGWWIFRVWTTSSLAVSSTTTTMAKRQRWCWLQRNFDGGSRWWRKEKGKLIIIKHNKAKNTTSSLAKNTPLGASQQMERWREREKLRFGFDWVIRGIVASSVDDIFTTWRKKSMRLNKIIWSWGDWGTARHN